MLRVKLNAGRILSDPAYLTAGARLYTTDEKRLGIKVAKRTSNKTSLFRQLLKR